MNDKKIKGILELCARDDAFRKNFLEKRRETLDMIVLSEAEKDVLCSASAEQLDVMIQKTRKRLKRKQAAEAEAIEQFDEAEAIEQFDIEPFSFATLGISPETEYENSVKDALLLIVEFEKIYYKEHGEFGDLESLLKNKKIGGVIKIIINENDQFNLDIISSGHSFTATVRHKTRPDTRGAFQIGPDGVVKELSNNDR